MSPFSTQYGSDTMREIFSPANDPRFNINEKEVYELMDVHKLVDASVVLWLLAEEGPHDI